MSSEKYAAETKAERRRFPRLPIKMRLSYQCLERDNVSKAEKKKSADIAAGGLAMYCERVLPLNQLLMLTVFLPLPEKRLPETSDQDIQEKDCMTVNILSRVAWCAPARTGGFAIGVQFLDMERDDRKSLKEFLVDYRIYPEDSSLYM